MGVRLDDLPERGDPELELVGVGGAEVERAVVAAVDRELELLRLGDGDAAERGERHSPVANANIVVVELERSALVAHAARLQPRHLGAVAHLHRVEELAAQLDLAPAVVGHVLDVVWKPAGVRPDRDVDVLAAEVVRLDEREGGEAASAACEYIDFGRPELRRAVLLPDLLATRQLDQLRNRINSAERWHTLVERPLAIYESRRLLFDIQAGRVAPTMVCDLRDAELRQLSWWQQAFTLLLEARDALAPQVELLINRVGGLMVLLLTRVVGRAIGLVGRGVMQGLGQGLQNAPSSGEQRS